MEKNTEKQVRSHNQVINMIIDDLIKGVRRRDIVSKYVQLLGNKENTVNHLIREALDSISIKSDEDREDLRTINVARLTDLYSKCYNEQNWKEARGMIDTLNKTANLYDTNLNVSQEDAFKFEFANEETPDEEEPEVEDEEE